MNTKLKAWLDSLNPLERSKAVESLGEIATETPEDKAENAARLAAGLPPVKPGSGDAVIDAVRKSAGLE